MSDQNDDKQPEIGHMSEKEVLQRWTVDELDMLHTVSGLGDEWMASERRAELKKIEDEEIEKVRNIFDEVHIYPEEESP